MSFKGRTIMNEFQNKVAIVMGGTSGSGRAAAVAYAREGAKVVVAGRRAAEGEETVRLLRAQGGEGFFVTTDVSKAVLVKELVERTLQKVRPARLRLQQRRDRASAESVPRARRGNFRSRRGHQREGRVAVHEVRNPSHAQDGRRLHCEYCFGVRSDRHTG